MKKREGFWFTVVSYIVENWLLPGYHLSKNPPKGSKRKKKDSILDIPDGNYPTTES